MIASAPAPVAPEAAAPHVLDAAFAALDAAGIAWCLLRDGDVHEPGGDVDLLVDRGSIDRAASTLREAGFVELPSLGRGSHRFFRALDRVSGAWIDLDVVTELAYGPHFSLKTGAEAACLARSWRPGRFPTVQPEDGFWGLLLHCLLDKRAFPERHARRLQELAPGAGTRAPLARAVARFAPGSCSPARLRAAAAAGDWDELLALAPALARSWRARQPAARLRALVRRPLRVVEKLLVPLGLRGAAVAVLGVDGAGKSTLIESLATAFPFRARRIYMGLWNAGTVYDRIPALRPARALLRPLSVWRRYVVALVHRLAGTLVLFDRYTYDAELAPRPPLVALKRAYLFLVARCCPPPALVVVLDVDPAVAARRGDGDAVAELSSDRERLLALAQRSRRFRVVDAGRPAAEVRDAVRILVWELYTR